ncbi:hypothetical protein LG634_17165 [Streptomyces bambusae]|uniref:hypothetical protein n=1 Tax=Streptomyces bambusae TaxID=1550616 RepID=UPI001CFCC076|nr:hypothetical protein [Streptomyces bambusae]MCB5166560.1 hypothetical protein [Streptomyces bambusae]
MEPREESKLEATLGDGRRVTLSLPPLDAPWAADGVKGLRFVPATHEGRGDEPAPVPDVEQAQALRVALMGFVA